MTLPSVVRSGVTPYSACAPPGCTRKPVITSSKTSSAPSASVSARRPSRKPSRGDDEAHVPGHRLDDHGGDLACVLGEQPLDRGEVVVRRGQRVRDRARRHAGRVRQAERRHAGARLDEQEVRVAVVAAGELDDLRAPGERAREPERAHRRLGARVDEAHELDARHRVADEPRELELERARRAVARAAAHRLLERRDDARVRVPEDRAAPRRGRSRRSGSRRRRRGTRPRRARRRPAAADRPERAAPASETPPGMSSLASAKSRSDVASSSSAAPRRARGRSTRPPPRPTGCSRESRRRGTRHRRARAPGVARAQRRSARAARGGRGRTGASPEASDEPRQVRLRLDSEQAKLVPSEAE